MRRRWREGPSLVAALTLLVASTTSNDSTLFECPKGSYRFIPPLVTVGPWLQSLTVLCSSTQSSHRSFTVESSQP